MRALTHAFRAFTHALRALFLAGGFFGLLGLLGQTALAAPLTIDPALSRIVAISKQMGVSVEGRFQRFTATVDFDPAQPEAGQATVSIDMNSFDIGTEEFSLETRKPEWFDTARHPTARFVTRSIRALGGGRYEAAGTLTLKGVSREVVASVTLASEGGRRTFSGALPIRRLDYRIGDGAWKDTSMVADEVEIRFRLVSRPD